MRIHAQVAGAGIGTPEEHVVPRLSAITRAENAALLVGAMGVAQGGDVHHVGIGRVNAQLGDVARISQTEVVPRPPGVGRTVHAIAMGYVATDAAFAHTRVDHVLVSAGDREGADRCTLKETVGDVLPIDPAVSGLPHPAAG